MLQLSPEALRDYIARLIPGATLEKITRQGVDTASSDREETEKGTGYGEPLRLVVRRADGTRVELVLHTASANDFGHDRRADRAAAVLLAYDTFGTIERQVPAVDVGAVMQDGSLQSLAGAGELFLITPWVPGRPYAEDLREIVHRKSCDRRDLDRCDALIDYLAALHRTPSGRPAQYRRSTRDLVGDGEGVFGIIDGYPDRTPGAPRSRLRAIEEACAAWRWTLRDRHDRARRVHGDFHPFNILFDERDQLHLLDASRGCVGDPADDVTCLAINYVFFALADPDSWDSGPGHLWRRTWTRYLEASGDGELAEVAPPYLAWRALVLCNPGWYPALTPEHRDRIFTMVERCLQRRRLDPDVAEDLFR